MEQRLGWAEADIRSLIVKLQASEQAWETARWQKNQGAEAERQAIEDARREIQAESRRMRSELASLDARIEGMAAFSEDNHMAVAGLTVWLVRLTIVCAVEAAAIVLLWWFR